MSFGSLLKKWIKSDPAPVAPAPAVSPAPTASSARPAIAYPSKKAAPIPPVESPVPTTPPADSCPPSSEDEAHTVELLRELMKTLAQEDHTVVRVPCKAVLTRLPEENRGPLWTVDGFPEAQIELPRDSVMEQLKSGCIRFPYTQFSDVIPEGWIVGVTASTALEFDLGEVVPAIPPDWFNMTSKIDESMLDVAGMHDYFQPGANLAAEPASPVSAEAAPASGPIAASEPVSPPVPESAIPVESEPVAVEPATAAPSEPPVAAEPGPPSEIAVTMPGEAPEPSSREEEAAAVIPPPGAVEPTPPPVSTAAPEISVPAPIASAPPERAPEPVVTGDEWSGVESGLDAGVNAVNLNTAGLEELQTLDGVGPAMARAILAYREQRGGKFSTIFELGDVPGVGPKHFQRMTGLDLNLRFNRHDVLRDLLKWEPEGRLTLPQITRQAELCLGVRHCILTQLDGLPLACGSADEATASGFGALVPPLFQRARRYLNGLTHDSIQVLVLPLAEPPLLLFGGRDIFVILLLNPGAPIDPVIAQAHFLARELDWLLGCRAIVRMT